MFIEKFSNKHGPLLLFLHGGGVSSWMWKEQVEYFTDYHVITVDLPEQGKSKHTEPFSIESSARQIISLIEQLANGRRVIVVGFSLGAQVLVQMLSMKSSLIDDAIINSALVKPNKLMQKMVRPSVKLSAPLMRSRLFARLQAKTLFINEEMFETYFEETSTMKVETLVRILEENMSFSLPEGFAKAKANILVTVGAKEKGMMKESAKLLVANNRHSVGVVIPNVGHGLPLINPPLFNELVESFLEGRPLPQNVHKIH